MEEKKPSERTKEISGGDGGTADGIEEDNLVFPGFRFHPTDQELVGFYLKRKVEKKGFSIDIIKEIDIYKHDPWDLLNEARQVVQQGSGDKDVFFFCLRGRKYRNSIRPNRVTGSGFWKATGIDKPIRDGAAGECVGLKKSLVYYRGSAGRGTKTDWMMHEFRLPSASSSSDLQDAEIWTICKIFKRNTSYNRRCQQKQEHDSKRTMHQQHQVEYHYDYRHAHQHHYSGGADAMASSFETTTDASVTAAYATGHRQPTFLLHGFHGASSPAVMTRTMSGLMGAPLPSPASGWKELTSRLQDGDNNSSWDELGKIMEI